MWAAPLWLAGITKPGPPQHPSQHPPLLIGWARSRDRIMASHWSTASPVQHYLISHWSRTSHRTLLSSSRTSFITYYSITMITNYMIYSYCRSSFLCTEWLWKPLKFDLYLMFCMFYNFWLPSVMVNHSHIFMPYIRLGQSEDRITQNWPISSQYFIKSSTPGIIWGCHMEQNLRR